MLSCQRHDKGPFKDSQQRVGQPAGLHPWLWEGRQSHLRLLIIGGKLVLLSSHPHPFSTFLLFPQEAWKTGSLPSAFQSDLALGSPAGEPREGEEGGGDMYSPWPGGSALPLKGPSPGNSLFLGSRNCCLPHLFGSGDSSHPDRAPPLPTPWPFIDA